MTECLIVLDDKNIDDRIITALTSKPTAQDVTKRLWKNSWIGV